MTRLLIAGATGLVGRHVLDQALSDRRVAQVVALTRRALPMHPKLLNPVARADDLPLDAEWWTVDSAISTLGSTRAKAGSREAFRAIDHDYPLAIARQVRGRGARALVLASAAGAHARSLFFYNRVKGDLELALAQLNFPSLTIARPGLLGGRRTEPRPLEDVAAILVRSLGRALSTGLRVNPAFAVAALMLEAAIDAPLGAHIISAADIVRTGARGEPGED